LRSRLTAGVSQANAMPLAQKTVESGPSLVTQAGHRHHHHGWRHRHWHRHHHHGWRGHYRHRHHWWHHYGWHRHHHR
jgi:Ni/Co efflux regulator RcnB